VGVSCSPVIPGITDSPHDLDALIHAAADAGGDYVFANPLFLKPCSAAVFLPFLDEHFPHLAQNYRHRYRDRAFLPEAYGKRLSQLVAKLQDKHNIARGDRRREGTNYAVKFPKQGLEEQMELF
jgi:DNA repair photolyase